MYHEKQIFSIVFEKKLTNSRFFRYVFEKKNEFLVRPKKINESGFETRYVEKKLKVYFFNPKPVLEFSALAFSSSQFCFRPLCSVDGVPVLGAVAAC